MSHLTSLSNECLEKGTLHVVNPDKVTTMARLRIASSWENQDFRVFFLVITRAHIADSKSINMCGVIV